MPEAGVPARARRRYATPWWEELDRDAFRFPTAYELEPAQRRVVAPAPAPVPASAPVPVRAAVAAVPASARLVDESTSPPAPVADAWASAPAAAGPRDVDGGRRTVTIRGRGAERNMPVARPTLRRHERPGFRPDRAALWAVMLGLLLILVAAASAHAAIPH